MDSVALPVSLGARLLRCIVICVSLVLAACEPSHLERPYGYLKLGKVQDLLRTETFLSNDRLFVRHDESGFSVMSTLCTKDLSPLVLKKSPEGDRMWVSRYSASTYRLNGKVITGPAIRDLPYYELKLDSSKYGGPKDTLYAVIGQERAPSWRLAIALPEDTSPE